MSFEDTALLIAGKGLHVLLKALQLPASASERIFEALDFPRSVCNVVDVWSREPTGDHMHRTENDTAGNRRPHVSRLFAASAHEPESGQRAGGGQCLRFS